MKSWCSDVSRKIMSGWGRNSGPVTCLQDGLRETPVTKAADSAGPGKVPEDV